MAPAGMLAFQFWLLLMVTLPVVPMKLAPQEPGLRVVPCMLTTTLQVEVGTAPLFPSLSATQYSEAEFEVVVRLAVMVPAGGGGVRGLNVPLKRRLSISRLGASELNCR